MPDTTMNGGAVHEVAELARSAQEVQQIELEDGRILADRSLTPIYDPEADSWPPPLKVHSLSGIMDYIEANPDELDLAQTVMGVLNPTEVHLFSKVMGPDRQRSRRLYARAEAFTAFEAGGAMFFGHYHPVEEMIVALQSRFQKNTDRDTLLELLARIDDSDTMEIRDSGTSQTVTAKSGASLVDVEDVPNPFELHPYRTFPEVEEQPESPFILRVKRSNGVVAALFEADGGAWRQAAVYRTRLWLEDQRDHSIGEYPKVIA